MANRLVDVVPGINGKAKRAKRANRGVSPLVPAPGLRALRMRQCISTGLGCGIPCLSLALSSIGGRLLSEGHSGLGWAFLGLCCSVLTVSLSHLAWAVRDITGAERWQAWALAVAVDVALVAGELATVAGFESLTVCGVMVGVTLVSAVLNCWAFLRCR